VRVIFILNFQMDSSSHESMQINIIIIEGHFFGHGAKKGARVMTHRNEAAFT